MSLTPSMNRSGKLRQGQGEKQGKGQGQGQVQEGIKRLVATHAQLQSSVPVAECLPLRAPRANRAPSARDCGKQALQANTLALISCRMMRPPLLLLTTRARSAISLSAVNTPHVRGETRDESHRHACYHSRRTQRSTAPQRLGGERLVASTLQTSPPITTHRHT
jgi:hypothetical protein